MANLIRHPSDEGMIYAAPDTTPCTRKVGRWVLLATILGSSMAMIDATAVNVALPVLQKSLNATIADVQWIVEAYALFLAALILVGGSSGDLFGRRRVFAIGVVLFAIASAGCGLSQNIAQMIVARALQGMGGALMLPGSLAIISTTFSKEQRGRAIGIWSSFTAITGASGPVLGGWLVEHVSWRGVFFLNIPLVMIVLCVLFWHVPESRDEEMAGKLDWPGAVLATIGLGGIIYGLITATNLGLGHPVVLSSISVGGIALIAFVSWEYRSRTPMMPLSLFRSPTFSAANVFTLLLYSSFGGVLFFFPFNLIQVQRYSATAAGAALLPMIVIVFLLSRWAGGLINRYGARLPLVVGSLIVATAFALYTIPAVGGSYWTTFFPAVVVQGIGMAFITTPLTATVMGAVEGQHVGIASGINNAVARTAALLSVAVLSIVFVNAFVNSFQRQLAALTLSPYIRLQLAAQQTKLVGIQFPSQVSSQTRVALEAAVAASYVTGFRTIMFVAVALALAGALTALFSIKVQKNAVKEPVVNVGYGKERDILREGQTA